MPVPMTVTEILDPQCVVVPLAAASKREAIDSLVDALSLTGFPTTVIVSADGTILETLRRALSLADVRSIVAQDFHQ